MFNATDPLCAGGSSLLFFDGRSTAINGVCQAAAAAANGALPSILMVLLAVSVVAYFFYRATKGAEIPSTVPGPRVPILGIMKFMHENWETLPSSAYEYLKENNVEIMAGPMPSLFIFPPAYFLTSNEANVKHILNDKFDNYVKGSYQKARLGDLLGEGIFTTDGAKWKFHRKLGATMFSRNLLRHSADVTLSKLQEIEKLLRKGIAKEQQASSEEPFVLNIQEVFFRMTVDTFAETAFGVKLDSIEKGIQCPFAQAFDEAEVLALNRFVDPVFEITRFLGIDPKERRIRKLIKEIDDFAYSIIRSQRRSSEDAQGVLGPDLVSRCLDNAKRKGIEPPTDKELRDVVLNFMIAGRDTTALSLSWAMYELTRHPDVVAQIIEEVESVCGVGEDADYSYDTVNKLQYTHAVIMEVVRLHCALPLGVKYAVQDDVLPDGTHVPKGSGVIHLPYAMGRSTKTWGEDALEFKPERFVNAKEPSQFKYIFFNAGPRVCLGKPLALSTMKLTLAYLLTRFEFEDAFGHSGEYKWTLVMHMKGGFHVRVRERSTPVSSQKEKSISPLP